MIGPIISGVMTQHVNWQSFWWLNVGLFGLLILLVLFCFPETKYTARGEHEDPQANAIANANAAGDRGETSSNEGSKVEETKTETGNLEGKSEGGDLEGSRSLAPVNTEAEVMAMDPWLHKGFPGKHQFPTLWYPRRTKGNLIPALIRDFWIPWKLFVFPIIQFAAFVFSWCASNFLALNLTQTQVFAAPPYNFSSQSIGFTNFAIFAGALFGLTTAGPLSDWVAMRQTIRNNGIREPEMRLLALIPYTVLLFLGSLISSLGYEYKWPWPVIICIGYAFSLFD
jgi:MFS family permease